MGLLTILRKVRQKEKEMRVLVLGMDNAGKTSIVKRLNGDDVRNVSPTLGFSIISIMFKDYNLNLWDVGGQKTIRTYWKNYFEQTDGIIWVVDCADHNRLESGSEELYKLLDEERLAGASLLVLANKQDLPDALSPKEVEEVLDLKGSASSVQRHWRVEGCSALCPGDESVSGRDNLREGVEWLIEDIAARVFMYD
uniref:ADP-ribosylation factor-like protein 2 n=2 Tax=Rhodosorus marinus TaxID=101924 RepID=A0A7S3A6C9_9RHOD|mmetsp:Transcript_44735/g.173561  ORF Transcript_44735/g.173561 Transcript_44735/m.173561 type:complete len:196 (+) Transcript_44735:136-723(+)